MIDLTKLGWKDSSTNSVRLFQESWALGIALKVDGIAGPKTLAAYHGSLNRKTLGKPTASEHFWFTEFACRCGRKTCARIKVQRDLILALEKLRDVGFPRGLEIVSGYRCPDYNRAIDGALDSQHMYGTAADIPAVLPASTVVKLDIFSGIGANGSIHGKVRHVDVRHLGPKNATEGNPIRPTRWAY